MIYDSKDGIIWDCIGGGACAFAVASTHKKRYCRSPYSVSGTCEREFCPLANAQYATLKEEDDRLYLLIKVIERQHQPATQWEHIELPLDYGESVRVLRDHLRYFDREIQRKCILRLTKFTEEFQRRQRIGERIKARAAPLKHKQERRERARYAKALRAAQIERTVERELMRYLQNNKYNGVFDVARHALPTAVQEVQEEHEQERELGQYQAQSANQ